jgi:bile acid-coenzyme A ligase
MGLLWWVDNERYYYLADRRTDFIILRGANIFYAEVASVPTRLRKVADVEVVGLNDDD